MTRILAIDLGKFKSVSCLLDTATDETEFWTLSTDRKAPPMLCCRAERRSTAFGPDKL